MELKLTGFAISAARTTGTEVACEVFAGFAAPEQYTNEINGTWTDVYGIAAVIYRCLTGCTPTEAIARSGGTMLEPMMINRNIPANISAVIMDGLQLSPDRRIRTITEFVDRLFSQPKPVESAPVEKAQLTRRELKQRKERAKTIAILVVAGVVLAAFIVVFVMTLNGAFSRNDGDSSQEPTVEAVTTEESTPAPETTTSQTESEPEPVVSDTLTLKDFDGSSYDYEVERYKNILTFVPTYVYSDEYESGKMFDQSIPAGTVVPTGTTIEITVSKGPSKVPLPDYDGMSSDKYTAELSKLNIKYSVETERSNAAETGNVARCSIEIGDLVDVENNQEIIVYIAENYEPTAEPTVEPTGEPDYGSYEGIPITEENIVEGTFD